MSYQIRRTNGAVLVEIPDQQINTSATSLSLVGRAAVNYGQAHAENFVHLLENFANSTAPSNPITGQIWFDTAVRQAKVWDGTQWRALGSATVGSGGAVGGGSTLAGLTSGTNRTAGAIGISVINGANSSTMTLIFAEGKIISAVTDEIIPVNQLPATITIENQSYTLAARFPNGLRKGFTLAASDYVFGGTATSANYADLAERYQASEPLQPGDVVEIGGDFGEVQKTRALGTTNVFGIVSTNPGVRLNEVAGSDETHPLIALAGRVPCKVVGQISKGDRLMASAHPGVATRWDGQDQLAILGRALSDNGMGEGVIEVVVGRF